MTQNRQICKFDQLPLRPNDPPYSAWGLWKDSQLGSLGHLTREKVLESAKSEIRTGERVSLNLPLDMFDPPFLGRRGFEREIINKAPRVINDDIISFNTQSSSQWDSFRHFAYQKEAQFYNGVTQDDIHAEKSSTVGSCSNWAEKGIVGCGVLLDFYSWAQQRKPSYNPLGTSAITMDDILTLIAEKNIQTQPGDILFLRTGFVKGYQNLNRAEREAISKESNFPGLGQSRETAEWLWENQFAAVAADSPAFECIPPVDPAWMLHPILLSGWRTPIGELFDLEGLSQVCESLNRWTFFVTSSPLVYTGAVATPPNAIAIF